VRGPLRGAKWISGAAAGAGKGLSIILNLVEPKQLELAKRLAPACDICFDIGANVGLYSLLFARYSKQVFAFEPFPRNISYLSKTLKLNGVGNVIIVPYAVHDSTKLMYFLEDKNFALGRLDNRGKLPCVAVSCDDFVSAYKIVPSLLKIDVEGSEMAVLNGAKNLLSKHRPIVLLSTHNEKLRISCLEILKKMKYQIQPLDAEKIERASEFVATP